MMRLDRLLAACGVCARSQARALVRAGRVTVGGAPAAGADMKVDPDRDDVLVDGARVRYSEFVYIMMNKPAGVITATEDARQETVLGLLTPELRRRGLFPAGRLDKDTTGLLILTDDGGYAHSVISPKRLVPKKYIATLDAPLDEGDAAAFAQGLTLGDGTRCLPALLEPAGPCAAACTVYEGKYHQVKRMFASRGKHVTALHRVSIGALELDEGLAPGGFRELGRGERELALAGQP